VENANIKIKKSGLKRNLEYNLLIYYNSLYYNMYRTLKKRKMQHNTTKRMVGGKKLKNDIRYFRESFEKSNRGEKQKNVNEKFQKLFRTMISFFTSIKKEDIQSLFDEFKTPNKEIAYSNMINALFKNLELHKKNRAGYVTNDDKNVTKVRNALWMHPDKETINRMLEALEDSNVVSAFTFDQGILKGSKIGLGTTSTVKKAFNNVFHNRLSQKAQEKLRLLNDTVLKTKPCKQAIVDLLVNYPTMFRTLYWNSFSVHDELINRLKKKRKLDEFFVMYFNKDLRDKTDTKKQLSYEDVVKSKRNHKLFFSMNVFFTTLSNSKREHYSYVFHNLRLDRINKAFESFELEYLRIMFTKIFELDEKSMIFTKKKTTIKYQAENVDKMKDDEEEVDDEGKGGGDKQQGGDLLDRFRSKETILKRSKQKQEKMKDQQEKLEETISQASVNIKEKEKEIEEEKIEKNKNFSGKLPGSSRLNMFLRNAFKSKVSKIMDKIFDIERYKKITNENINKIFEANTMTLSKLIKKVDKIKQKGGDLFYSNELVEREITYINTLTQRINEVFPGKPKIFNQISTITDATFDGLLNMEELIKNKNNIHEFLLAGNKESFTNSLLRKKKDMSNKAGSIITLIEILFICFYDTKIINFNKKDVDEQKRGLSIYSSPNKKDTDFEDYIKKFFSTNIEFEEHTGNLNERVVTTKKDGIREEYIVFKNDEGKGQQFKKPVHMVDNPHAKLKHHLGSVHNHPNIMNIFKHLDPEKFHYAFMKLEPEVLTNVIREIIKAQQSKYSKFSDGYLGMNRIESTFGKIREYVDYGMIRENLTDNKVKEWFSTYVHEKKNTYYRSVFNREDDPKLIEYREIMTRKSKIERLIDIINKKKTTFENTEMIGKVISILEREADPTIKIREEKEKEIKEKELLDDAEEERLMRELDKKESEIEKIQKDRENAKKKLPDSLIRIEQLLNRIHTDRQQNHNDKNRESEVYKEIAGLYIEEICKNQDKCRIPEEGSEQHKKARSRVRAIIRGLEDPILVAKLQARDKIESELNEKEKEEKKEKIKAIQNEQISENSKNKKRKALDLEYKPIKINDSRKLLLEMLKKYNAKNYLDLDDMILRFFPDEFDIYPITFPAMPNKVHKESSITLNAYRSELEPDLEKGQIQNLGKIVPSFDISFPSGFGVYDSMIDVESLLSMYSNQGSKVRNKDIDNPKWSKSIKLNEFKHYPFPSDGSSDENFSGFDHIESNENLSDPLRKDIANDSNIGNESNTQNTRQNDNNNNNDSEITNVINIISNVTDQSKDIVALLK